MSKVFFISDLHFGHNNNAKRRGFTNYNDHDYFVVEKWNSVVNKHDKVFVLGDVTMHKHKPYKLLNLLSGEKEFVLGNHDSANHIGKLINYGKVSGMIKYKKVIWLTHCPVHPKEFDYRVKYNIHGHIHGYEIDDKRYICVCAEKIGYIPKTLEELGIKLD